MPQSEKKRIAVLGWINSVHVQRWVKGLATRGFETKVISLGGEPKPGIDAAIIPRSGRVSYIARAGLAVKEVADFQPHLVHAHSAAGYGWWMLRCKARPRVVSVWGADVIDFPNNWLKRAFIRRVLESADHITATSQLLRGVAEKLLPRIADKITIIPFGVRVLESFRPPPPLLPIRLCFIKAHKYKYGPDILLQAMTTVVKAIPSIQLSIAGVGELTPLLRKMTTELNLDGNVEFVGSIDNAKIYDFVQEHHLMVMPSVMESESFGVAVLEASICGRPVIASEIGGVPEVLVDGKTGLLVPPADASKLAEAIIKLATNPELCAQMGRDGHSFVSKRYDWEDSLDAMVELYGRMIKEAE